MRPQSRYFSNKKGNLGKSNEKAEDAKAAETEEKPAAVTTSLKTKDNDSVVAEEEDQEEFIEDDETEMIVKNLPAAIEKALVRATVPDNVPELIAVPIDRRPVFPGFYKTFTVKDEQVAAALTKAMKKGRPYVGLFLNKQQHQIDGAEDEGVSPDRINTLDEIHRIGTFGQLVNLIPADPKHDTGITAIVFPHRRIRAVELLPEEPEGVSRVRVENVPLQPFNRHNQVIQALKQEVFVMLSEVAKLNPFFREHITHHNVPSSIFEEPAKLADFIAVLTSSPAADLQEVLESDQVEERLRKALLLLKKELITAELQNTIRKDVESKLNKKQREYLLHEQLKSIKKELGLETDTKEKLTEMFQERTAKLSMPEEVKRVFDEVELIDYEFYIYICL